MTLAPLSTADARLPGSRYGGHAALTPRPRKHAPGRVCATPGCGTILRSTNPDQTCDPCQRKARRARETQKEAVTLAAGKQQQKTVEREAKILAYLADGEWHHARACAEAIGFTTDGTKHLLQGMASDGLIEGGGRGGKGYRLRQDVAAKASASVKDEAADCQVSEPAPDTSPAPAPDPPSGATPDAAASDSASPELQGPPSFGEHEYTAASPEDIAEAMRRACTAADETITVDWAETRIGRIEMSESGVIGWFEDALPAERVRLLSYIWDRWNT